MENGQVKVSLAMKRLMYYNLPKKALYLLLIKRHEYLPNGIDLNWAPFYASLLLTKNPINFPIVTPKVNFCGLNQSLHSLIGSKELLNVGHGFPSPWI